MISICNKTLVFPFCGLENEGNTTYFQGLLGGASGVMHERHLHAVPGTRKLFPSFLVEREIKRLRPPWVKTERPALHEVKHSASIGFLPSHRTTLGRS